jgi:hypothetical protein
MTADRSAQLAQHFRTPDAIPAEQRLAASVHQRASLVGGRMLEWTGRGLCGHECSCPGSLTRRPTMR